MLTSNLLQCAILLAVIEGVGIGIQVSYARVGRMEQKWLNLYQRMMAENTRLDVSLSHLCVLLLGIDVIIG